MYALEELWRGNISPTEHFVRSGSEYGEAARKLSEELDRLMDALPSEARKRMENVDHLRADMTALENEDCFLYGFRLGARLILDIVGGYPGQFYAQGEESR